MAFEYVGLASCLKPVSVAFENPFGLEHLATAQQKRDQSRGGEAGPIRVDECLSLSIAPLSLATPHLSPHVSSQLSLSLHYLPLSYYGSPLSTREVHIDEGRAKLATHTAAHSSQAYFKSWALAVLPALTCPRTIQPDAGTSYCGSLRSY